MKKVIVVAHRGKGPTSKFTAPTEQLWVKCRDTGLLLDKVVPQKILESFNIRLPEYTPPENTIAAFRQGLEEGADGIELDIFLSKDGVPMVIHDDELNRNVSGARRKITELRREPKQGDDSYLGNVHDLTALELKRFDMGDRNNIPTLIEVVDFLVLFNKIRTLSRKDPIILNIEFKDKTDINVINTLKVIGSAIENRKLLKDSVIYCSFDHNSLFEAITLDSKIQVALALKTAFLFGEDNVNTQAGWTVGLGTKYQKSAISDLEQKIIKAMDLGSKITGLDAVLWDIEEELVILARKYKLDLHASTSDFRDFTNVVFLGNLVKICQTVKVFFKTDEPKKISDILQRAYRESDIDLSKSKIVTYSETPKPMTVVKQSDGLDLTNVKLLETKDFSFLRQPKPKQAAPEDYQESSIEKLEGNNKLAQYIKDRCKKSAEIVFLKEQLEEKSMDNVDLINIFEILPTGELMSYWNFENIAQ